MTDRQLSQNGGATSGQWEQRAHRQEQSTVGVPASRLAGWTAELVLGVEDISV